MNLLLPLVLALAGAPAPPDTGARWRVVVQDAMLVPSAATPDRVLVAGAAGVNSHFLQVVDTKAPRVVLGLAFPFPIDALAFTPDQKRLAVSTRQGIWLVTLEDGRAEELLPGVSGVVTFNADATLLGVLGHIPEEKRVDAPPGLERTSTLGVYDLKEKRWQAKSDAPIAIRQTVVFEDDTLVGYGHGGRVFNRVASSFECDVRLNAKTGEAKLSRGVEGPRRGPGGDKGPGDAGYQAPRSITEEIKRLEEIKKLGSLIQEKLSPTGGRELRTAHFAALESKGRLLIAVQRFVGQRACAAAIVVQSDGTIDLGPLLESYEGALPTCGTLACITYADSTLPVVDLVTGKTLFEIPKDQDKHGARHILLAGGALVNHKGFLSYYKPGAAKPSWTKDQPESSPLTLCPSLDGRTLALLYPANKVLARLFQADNGKELCEVPRPEGVNENFAASMSFDPAAARFAVLIGQRLMVHDVQTGKLLAEQPFPREDTATFVQGLQDGWLVSGFYHSRIWDEKKGFTTEFPLGNVNHVEEIASPVGKRLLLESSEGYSCIADPISGKILTRWVGGAYHSTGSTRERPPDALAAFGGRLLIRGTGWAGAVELVDQRTLHVVLTIHPVPVREKLGWIAYTPDGLWDASAGAERFVQVFRGEKLGDAQAREERHDESGIRARLKALCRGE